MTDTPQPTSGSLSAKIIRACTRHTTGGCPLDCKYRVVEDLGQIASFDTTQESTAQPSFGERVKHLFRKDSV
jgi:hypothetical protein